MRSLRPLLILLVVGVIAVGSLILLFLPRGNNPITSNTGGTFVEGVVGTPQFMNPLLCDSDTDRDLCGLLFSGLTRFDENGEVVPDLASSRSERRVSRGRGGRSISRTVSAEASRLSS